MQETWRFTLFGKLQCQRGLEAISRYQTRQGNIFLGYLALHRDRNHTREELATLIWPEDYPSNSISKLRKLFYILRKSFEPAGVPRGSVFICDHSTIQLNPSLTSIDVHDFEELITSARQLPYSQEKAEKLKQAVEMSREPFLKGLAEAWVLKERRRLKELYSEAGKNLAECWEALGDLEQAIQAASAQIKSDQLNEQSHYRLIRLYGYANEPKLANEQYRKLCKILNRELGVIPTEETRNLIKQILEGTLKSKPYKSDGQSLKVTSKKGAGISQARWVGVHPTKLYGREKELNLITDLIASGQRRVVTITGLPGIGKSRLATEVVHRLHNNLNYYVAYIDVSAVESLDMLKQEVSAVIEEVRLTEPEQYLVFLDGLRSFGDEGALCLSQLLNEGNILRLLITSLQRVGLGGEQEVPLGTLPVPQITDSIECVLANPSVQLFSERARSICADFKVTVRNVRALMALCQALEGYPLQLLLAASNRNNYSTEQMQAGFDDRASLLQTRRKDILQRHQSWSRAIGAGFEQLSQEAQNTFLSLITLPCKWTLETASSQLGQEIDKVVLAELEECAWVRVTPGTPRTYSILPSLIEYGAELASRHHVAFSEN